jgi:hypothetical protein
MRLFPVCVADGSWTSLKDAWRQECDGFGEDFTEYAVGSFAALDPLAADGHPRASVYAFEPAEGAAPTAICQLNRTPLPGYDGMVLRMRYLTLSPICDFGDNPVDFYGMLLGGIFAQIVSLSYGVMNAPHIKFHLASPADRQFFAALVGPLSAIDQFQSVNLRGS